MKSYPKIEYKVDKNIPIYAFDKLDGSNIRAEWNTKKGFWKFGTRKRLLDTTEFLGKSINLIIDKYEDDLARIFYKQKYGRVLCFFEFHGENSFAGNHEEDEEHTVTLIDVNPFKKGILPPKEFLKQFGKLDIPECLYYGRVGNEFIKQVRESELKEGVVCKGLRKKLLVMFKIKTKTWIDKVKAYYGLESDLLDRTELTLIDSKKYRQRRFCPSCFVNGSLSPVCKCGCKTLSMPFEAQPPRKNASKTRWRKFFNEWYPELNFNTCWRLK